MKKAGAGRTKNEVKKYPLKNLVSRQRSTMAFRPNTDGNELAIKLQSNNLST